MQNIITNTSLNKVLSILKILVVISFSVILVPEADSPPSFMVVDLMRYLKDLIITKTKPFDIFTVLFIGYWLSIIYLLFLSHSTKQSTKILTIVSLFVLCIPALLTLFYLLAIHAFFNTSIIAIIIFFAIMTWLWILLFRQPKV